MTATATTPTRWRTRVPGWWVFTRRTWFVFFLREITCLFVAYFAVAHLAFVRSVLAGPEAYERHLGWLRRPWVVGLHALVLVAVLWHTFTWFVAAPKALRPMVGGKPVPAPAIVGGHYALWAVVSAVLYGLLL
jgi:fumarate reductase subunit C